MKTLMKTALLAGAAWSALSASALAQNTFPTAESSAVDDIIVTARRRDEQLKDVPVAVSALGAERLEQTGAADITALQQQTPNATVQIARGSNSTLISFVRGVGQQDPLWGFEPGVGLYVDDVYVARPQGAVLDIFDIERIEVLRGPQGTLYGRNTIGGAMKYVTRRLGVDPSLTLRGAVGSYGQADIVATGVAPLTDTFRLGGSVARLTRNGYGSNLNTGAEHYDKDVAAFRLSAEWDASDRLWFRLAGDRVEDRSNPRHGHREVAGVGPGAQVPASVYDTYAGIGDDNYVVTNGLSLTAEYRISDSLTFKSITAYRDGSTDTVIDFDNTPANTLDIPAIYADDQFTQEFQLLFDTDRVQGVAGLFYLDGTASGAFDTILGAAGIAIGAGGQVETESWAAFADVNIDLSDRLHLGLGARYTEDTKNAQVLRLTYLGAVRTPLTGGAPAVALVTNTNYANSGDYSDFSPRVSLSYDLSDDVTGYVSWSSGFKSGGFDMRGDASLTPNTVNGYQPETVDSYEIGLKGRAFDRRLSFSSAFFYNQYKDQQVTTQVPAGANVASFVDNVGQSTIYGAEFEGSLFLSDNLTANFALGWLEAEFDEFIRFNLATGQFENISNLVVLQNAPKWTGYLGVTWTGELAGGQLAVTPSVSYRDSYSMFEYPNPWLDQDGFALVDLSAVWSSPDDRWTVGVYGRNLTDERYRVGGYTFAGALFNDSHIGYYGPPRTWTVSLQAKF